MFNLEEWVTLCREIYPPQADICVDGQKHVREKRIRVSWLLENDPVRPHKRSKTIVIEFSSEFIDDFSDGDGAHRTSEGNKTESLLKAHLQSFEPNHNYPTNACPPIERIVIETTI